MSALEVILVAAVFVGMSVQAAIGFGFALVVAPAAFAAFSPERAVTLVVLLAIAINLLVLFTERRRTEVAGREVATMLVAAVPGLLAGVWLLERIDRELLQLLVGVVVVVAAIVQAIAIRRPAPAAVAQERRPALEVGAGLTAGALTTSVSVNGPVLVLAFTHLGLRGTALRDSLAAALLGLALIALPVLLIGSADAALPGGWVALACVPALVLGHRLGAAVFGRLGDRAHARIVLVAAGLAGALSIAAALLD